MRHRDGRQRLTQKPAHARMLKRNLVTSILLYESVRTTKARAKAVAPVVDRLISKAKKQEPHVAIRYINKVVTDKNASRKIMEVFKHRYANRTSGLTRIVPAGVRTGDGAMLVDFSFVEGEDVPTPEVKKEAPKKEAKKPAAKKAPAKAKTASAKAPAAKKATPKTTK